MSKPEELASMILAAQRGMAISDPPLTRMRVTELTQMILDSQEKNDEFGSV